jgi:hypothetical protein
MMSSVMEVFIVAWERTFDASLHPITGRVGQSATSGLVQTKVPKHASQLAEAGAVGQRATQATDAPCRHWISADDLRRKAESRLDRAEELAFEKALSTIRKHPKGKKMDDIRARRAASRMVASDPS